MVIVEFGRKYLSNNTVDQQKMGFSSYFNSQPQCIFSLNHLFLQVR